MNKQGKTTQHPDIEAFLVMHDENNAYIFHEHPFESPLQWVEYDSNTGQLDFILDTGRIENFGIAIQNNIGRYLKNLSDISVAHKDGAIVIKEIITPLVVH